jgi:hypothetical protein
MSRPITQAPSIFAGREYRAISLWQPWASLIFTGDKRHETRHWAYPDALEGEWVAIHAAKRPIRPAELGVGLDLLCRQNWGPDYARALPLGAIVGLVALDGCYRTDEREPASPMDRMAGNWEPGRFAWRLSNPMPCEQPLPCKGRQGWFRIRYEDLA